MLWQYALLKALMWISSSLSSSMMENLPRISNCDLLGGFYLNTLVAKRYLLFHQGSSSEVTVTPRLVDV